MKYEKLWGKIPHYSEVKRNRYFGQKIRFKLWKVEKNITYKNGHHLALSRIDFEI